MNRLNDILNSFDIVLSDNQLNQFEKYYNLLIDWNRVMNLTGITEFNDVLTKHFVDSLSIVRVLNLSEYDTLIDVGTGAGFPGIPIKIAFPHIRVVLLDSLNKRVNFLNAVIDALSLSDIHAVHGRAEDIARRIDYRESFDLCVSRAVANLSTLSEYCLPFVKVGGMFVSYKSGQVKEELAQSDRAVNILGGEIGLVDKFTLPGSDDGRSFVCIEKKKHISKKYPRRAGLPSREPLS